MPPKEDADSAPITVKELVTWVGAISTVLTLVITGVVTFCHIEAREDLTDQAVVTIRAEGLEHRLTRDKQYETLNARCDQTERNVSDLTRTLADVEQKLAVMQSRQDDSLILLKKIDDKVNGPAK